ncbi:MAG TPA: DUF892 family protein [Solirubrobacteraceae bacterium]|nr:DUF892 family protein [Solirubrobacteraceae bacterium]
MAELSASDGKLVQYLNEAYGKEKELETALQAHIAMTTRAPYRKRLQQHLTETKRHAREVERRIKRLGGNAQAGPLEGTDPVAKGAGLAMELGSRAVAAAKGPLHALRGTGEQEKMLKNAKSEYADEHEEIATYSAIETLAQALGDSETAKLARTILRDEQGMARFLERQIPALTKAVIQAEIPASERRNGSGARRKRSRSSAGAKRATKASSARKASAKKAGARKARTASASSGAASTAKASTRSARTAARAAGTPASSSRTTKKASSRTTKAGRAAGA